MNTFDRVKVIIVETLGCQEEDVVPDADLVDDLGADSLDIVEIATEIEDEFDLEIPDTDAVRLRTIDHVIQYVENHQ